MNSSLNDSIRLLPEHIIDQIKAGEVIERPATLIKELLENSIDAGSKNISVHIINNGMDLIAVEDDGKGISHDELPLAFCRHATSKIDHFEDIYNLHTYGFRGEALASMASISKITCNSTKNGETSILKIHAGETISHQKDSGSQNGTKIYVKDLFYNTPVRLKFIQSKTSEKNQLKKILNAFLLTHPEVSFSIKWDDQDKDFYPAVKKEELEKRILKMFFKKKECTFIKAQSEYDGVCFEGYVTKESNRANSGKHQYLFINKRFVQDVAIHKVILNSSSSAWPFGETGHYFAFIDLPSDQLDVNVHPNKTVVKLFRASQIYSQISSSIKKVTSVQKDFETSSFERKDYHSSVKEFFGQQPTQENKISEISNKDFQYKSTYLTQEQLCLDDDSPKESLEVLYKAQHHAICKSINFEVPLLVNLNKLVWFHFKSLLKVDATSIPLLVSEPLRDVCPNAYQTISNLNQYGFEIDKLDAKTFIIRAFPAGLDGYNYMSLLKVLLNDDIKMNKLSLIDKVEYLINNNIDDFCEIDNFKLKNIINNTPIHFLLEDKIACLLDKAKLDQFFYE